MASPQPSYPQPVSTYYHHPSHTPPPHGPHYGFGNRPHQYPNQYSHHMNGHPPMHPSPNSPPRMNGPLGRGFRSVPGYQNYHPQQQHQPHPQVHPGSSNTSYAARSQHLPKLPHPYSPPYNTPYFQPNWNGQQPISPLPKQLLMPPPPTSPPPSSSQSPRQDGTELPTSASPLPPPDSPPRPLSPPRSQISSPTSPPTPSPRRSSSDLGGWVIWSRPPRDATSAPGVIFSSKSHPPPNIIEGALSTTTPPSSPKLLAKSLNAPVEPTSNVTTLNEELPSPPSPLPLRAMPSLPSPPPLNHLSAASLTSSSTTVTTPACSTAPDTPVLGSPLSTNTSISVSGPTIGKAAGDDKAEPTPPKPATPPAAPAPLKKSWASLLRPSSSPQSVSQPNGLPTSSVVGVSIPASPSPPIPPRKKSDLLALLTRPGIISTGAPKIRPRGLINSGNMCFANAVLQVLLYSPPFWRLFEELDKVMGGSAIGDKGTPLVNATAEFLKEFKVDEDDKAKGSKGKQREEEDGQDSFLPGFVYDALKQKKRFDNMRGGQQEDAEEFFGFYLDSLEEELLSMMSSLSPKPKTSKGNGASIEEREEEAPPPDVGWMEVGKRNRTVVTRTIRSTESPISRIFGGTVRSTIRAPQQKESVIVEDWRSLRLDIQREQVRTIQDALSNISAPQSVSMAHPSRPGITMEASQQVLIEALPPILVLHLKRFSYDKNVGGVVKESKQIAFGEELEIGGDVMVAAARKISARYKLFGVLYHHGMSASGGHYTIDVLHPNRDNTSPSKRPREAWIRIDDEFVLDVKPEDVFGGLDREGRCAYLLFYRRVSGGGSRGGNA